MLLQQTCMVGLLWGSIINSFSGKFVHCWIAGCMCCAYLCGWSLWPQAGTMLKSPWDVEFIFMALDPKPQAYWFKINYGCIAWKHLLLWPFYKQDYLHFVVYPPWKSSQGRPRRPNRFRRWRQQGQHRFQGRLSKFDFYIEPASLSGLSWV